MKEITKILKRHKIEIILSLVLSVLLILLLFYNLNPLELKLNEQVSSKFQLLIYDDLDSDGISEKILLHTEQTSPNQSIVLSDKNGSITNQYNLYSYSKPEWIYIKDYNNDNYKEIIAFSQKDDSLYLTIIDGLQKTTILSRHLILTKPALAKKDFWDIDAKFIGLTNIDDDDDLELVFALKGGLSIYPRSIYTFDIVKKQIIDVFPTTASFESLFLLDINKDGKQEIIVSSSAADNIKNIAGYNDQTSWLFVLNHQLKPILKPQSFGSIFSSVIAEPIESTTQNLILAVNHSKNLTNVELINSSGKIIKSINFGNRILYDFIKLPNSNNDLYYLLFKDATITIIDKNLNIIDTTLTFPKSLQFINVFSYNSEGDKAILVLHNQNLLLLDKNFKTLARQKFDDGIVNEKYVTQKYSNNSFTPQLAINGYKYFYLFSIEESRIYKYLPFIFSGSFLLFFLILIVLHKTTLYILTYFNYFNHSLHKSAKGIILLNSFGEVVFSNKKLPSFILQKDKKIKDKSFSNLFNNMEDITKTICKTIKSKQKTTGEITYNKQDVNFKGEVKVTPFKFLGYTFAYLIEIFDYTQQISSDRMKTWSSTIQRIAHEIKTPLSGINLGLDTLQNRLALESDKYSKDISLIQNEVDRIRTLTKNFLLFSNLEKPNFVKIKLNNLLNDSLSPFQSYLNSGIELTITPSDYSILGDVGQLKQLFHIILENAIDACGGKGRIEIKTETGDRRKGETEDERREMEKSEKVKVKSEKVNEETKNGKREKQKIIITVSDNGKGISKEDLSKIFEPYFTTKKDGTGIGLAITKKIVEDHKGKIEINSELGVGTEVHIYLPRI